MGSVCYAPSFARVVVLIFYFALDEADCDGGDRWQNVSFSTHGGIHLTGKERKLWAEQGRHRKLSTIDEKDEQFLKLI